LDSAEESLCYNRVPKVLMKYKKEVPGIDIQLVFVTHDTFPDILLETSSKEVLKQFASNGLGVAFIPDMTAEREVESKHLVRLDRRGNAFPIYSQIFVHKHKHVSKAISSLVDIIQKEIQY